MKKLIYGLIALMSIGFTFAQNYKLSFPEEQVFKKGAKEVVKDFLYVVAHMKDSTQLRSKYTPKPEKDPDNTADAGFDVVHVSYPQLIMDYFFRNSQTYLYNDLYPKGGNAPRVLPVNEYLSKVTELYKDGVTITLDNIEVKEIKYNGKYVEPFYYAKVKVKRTLKGTFMGTTFTKDVREYDFYIKTVDHPSFKLKKFHIMTTDKDSRQVVDNYGVEEGISKGLLAFDTGDYNTAYKLLYKRRDQRKLKRNGNATSALAYMYFFGWGTPDEEPDFEKMKPWLLLAGDRNNMYALYSLGDLYYFGQYGFEENDKKAMECYKKAARKGLPMACFSVGEMYEKGQGKNKKIGQAKRWYKKGAKKGDKKCQEALKRLGEKW